MANPVDRKWQSEADIDSEDPLMQLSRIMSESLSRQETSRGAPEKDIDFDFDDDFSVEIEDDAVNHHHAAPPVELSLEDELNALLSDAPQAPVAPPVVHYQEPRYEAVSLPTEVEHEVVDDGFEADPWLDENLVEGVEMAAGEPEYVADEPRDAVLEQLHYGRGNARFASEVVSPEVNTPAQALDDPSFDEEFEFDMEPDLAPVSSADLAPNSPIEFARGSLVPPAPEFDDWQDEIVPEHAHAVTSPEQQVDFTDDFDRLLAVTAPEPVVEAATIPSDHIVATEEFDIPDFEFNDEPEITVSPSHDSEDEYAADYRSYEAPAVVAAVAVAATAHAASTYVPRATPQVAAIEDDFDFESELNDELSADLDSTIGGYQPDTSPAAYRPNGEYSANTVDEFDNFADLDVVQPSATYGQEPSRNRSWLTAAALAAVMLLGGAGYYAYSKSDAAVAASGGPVLVKADPEPVKVAPEVPGGKVIADQDKAVYNKVGGTGDALAAPGQLVTASEEPVDIAAVASDPMDEGDNVQPETAKVESAAAVQAPAVPAAQQGKAEDRVDPALDPETVPTATADATAVAPKKVRTFVVKPDGSLVERAPIPVAAEPVAEVAEAPAVPAAEPAPVAKSEAPAPAIEPKKVEQVAIAEPVAETQAAEEVKPAVEAKTTPAIKVVKAKKIKAPKAETDTLNADATSGEAPIIDARPADQPVNIVGKTGGKKAAEETQVAAADTAPVATADQSPAATGAYVMQIASTPSADAAKATYAALSRKFSGVIGGRGVNIQQAEVAGKGTVFRVRIPAGSKQDANALCAQYKSSGGSCFVSR